MQTCSKTQNRALFRGRGGVERGRVGKPGWGPVGRGVWVYAVLEGDWAPESGCSQMEGKPERQREAAWLCRSRAGGGWIVFDAAGIRLALISRVPSRAAHERWSEPPVPLALEPRRQRSDRQSHLPVHVPASLDPPVARSAGRRCACSEPARRLVWRFWPQGRPRARRGGRQPSGSSCNSDKRAPFPKGAGRLRAQPRGGLP